MNYIDDIEIQFRPRDVDKFEKLSHKSLMGVIGRIPTLEEVAFLLIAGSCGKVKTKDEAFNIFEKVGYVKVVETVNEELANTGWLTVANIQEEEEAKN